MKVLVSLAKDAVLLANRIAAEENIQLKDDVEMCTLNILNILIKFLFSMSRST